MSPRTWPDRAGEKEISTLVGKPRRRKIVPERDQLAPLGELKSGFFAQLAQGDLLDGTGGGWALRRASES